MTGVDTCNIIKMHWYRLRSSRTFERIFKFDTIEKSPCKGDLEATVFVLSTLYIHTYIYTYSVRTTRIEFGPIYSFRRRRRSEWYMYNDIIVFGSRLAATHTHNMFIQSVPRKSDGRDIRSFFLRVRGPSQKITYKHFSKSDKRTFP